LSHILITAAPFKKKNNLQWHPPSPPPSLAMPPPQTLLEGLKDYGHEDTFALCDELSPDKHGLLIKEIEIIFYPSSKKKTSGIK